MKTKNRSLFSRMCKCYGKESHAQVQDQIEEEPSTVTKVSDEIREICKDMILSDDKLRQLMDTLNDQLHKGLAKETHPTATTKCFPTYVQDLPQGTEKGNFLALDLGGTNFRVLLITLDNQNFDMKSKIYVIPQSLMVGTGVQLFDHIAQCLAMFIKDLNLQHEVLPLGFTFSFPLIQHGLTKGYLVRWTKGFKCDDIIGQDVVELLEQAIKRRDDVKIEICAILNDTTGTLMSCAWKNKNCRIGLIVGTGTNACYVEKLENIETVYPENVLPGKPKMLINIEWGAFGEGTLLDFISTDIDRDVDQNSINPEKQVFEKMISGMYMGELVRLLIEKAINAGLLFNGKPINELKKRGRFYAKYVSEIENDPNGKYTNCREVLAELGLRNVTDQDCENVKYICSVVSRRAAHLASAGIATLLNKMGEDNVVVGIDGSVYRYHPHFHNLMTEKIGQLQSHKFELMLSEDGSGRGAALVAAVAAGNR
ncbi:hexokinase type 2 isoform X2 [Apis dorsata]|uniref:hexokinase type 2 isoform X2 n=1 Tax=Apis dorsata TaxID=7462 RepID=UPI0003DF6DBA|nr:hexokinase type 2 isoform X2 [Apis dorsata]